MWKSLKNKVENIPDEKKIKSISFWHFILVAFIVLWMVGAYVYLDKKSDIDLNAPPVIVLDTTNGLDLTNFFSVPPNNKVIPATTIDLQKPMFEIKKKYLVGDIVVVKYFYVEAVVIGIPSVGEDYTILYKDHNHTLQRISLPKTMLMAPAEGVVNPVSLLVD